MTSFSDPSEAFRTKLQNAGQLPSEITPGKIQRCGTASRPHGTDGWFVFFQDPPGGAFGDWRAGTKETWSGGNGTPMDRATRRRIEKAIQEEQEARNQRDAETHAEAAEKAAKILDSLPDATDENPYLKSKGVKALSRLKAEGDTLIVPVLGLDGKPISLQRIQADGTKKFMPGGKVSGGFFPIRGLDEGPLFIVEGLATGLTIHEETAQTVVCAFSAGNLEHVAREARRRYQDREIVVCADDDRTTAKKIGTNVGVEKATKAARAVNGQLATPGRDGDFNDLRQAKGPEAVWKRLEAAKAPLKPKTSEKEEEPHFFTAEDLLSRSFEKNPPIIAGGIMPYGAHILISGEAGVGKSLLRMELGLHLTLGWEWLGFGISTARRIAVFQFENTEAMEQARLRRMCTGLGITSLPKGSLRYIDRKNRLDLTTKRDRKKLEELVSESEAEVLVYDCLSNLHSSDENKNMAMREVLDSLTEVNAKCGTSCILIHHFGKPSEGQANRYRTRGAQSIIDWAVTAAGFINKPHEHRVLRTLEFFKVRDGAMPKPLLLERDENFLMTRIEEDTLCPPHKVKEILEDMGGEVDRQGTLVQAITQEVGCSPRSARTFIKRAAEMKVITGKTRGNGHAKGYLLNP